MRVTLETQVLGTLNRVNIFCSTVPLTQKPFLRNPYYTFLRGPNRLGYRFRFT
jgi:hypothetical protein